MPRPIAFEGEEVFVGNLMDSSEQDGERNRLTKLCEQKRKQIAGFEGKLSNENYVAKAKPELVQQTRDMLEQSKADLATAESALNRMVTPESG